MMDEVSTLPSSPIRDFSSSKGSPSHLELGILVMDNLQMVHLPFQATQVSPAILKMNNSKMAPPEKAQ